jgi:hypothetical protein
VYRQGDTVHVLQPGYAPRDAEGVLGGRVIDMVSACRASDTPNEILDNNSSLVSSSLCCEGTEQSLYLSPDKKKAGGSRTPAGLVSAESALMLRMFADHHRAHGF